MWNCFYVCFEVLPYKWIRDNVFKLLFNSTIWPLIFHVIHILINLHIYICRCRYMYLYSSIYTLLSQILMYSSLLDFAFKKCFAFFAECWSKKKCLFTVPWITILFLDFFYGTLDSIMENHLQSGLGFFDRNCKDVQTPAHFLISTISQRSNNIYFSALKSLENFSPMLDWSTFNLSFYNKHFSDLGFHLAEPRNKVKRSCQE